MTLIFFENIMDIETDKRLSIKYPFCDSFFLRLSNEYNKLLHFDNKLHRQNEF